MSAITGSRRRIARAYALLLLLYPSEHRRTWGPGMQATFERRTDEMAGAGRAHRMRFAAAEVYAVLRAAAAERLSQLPFLNSGGRRRATPHSPRSPRRDIVHDTLFDIRLAWRAWKREPMTAIVVALTLALSIGAATIIFSVVDGVVLRPLPFPQADRLVALMETLPDGRSWTLSMPDFVDYRQGPMDSSTCWGST